MSQKLKIIILERKFKQREVAQALGWSDSKLSDFITGRRVPNEEDLGDLAGVLSMPVEKLRKACKW